MRFRRDVVPTADYSLATSRAAATHALSAWERGGSIALSMQPRVSSNDPLRAHQSLRHQFIQCTVDEKNPMLSQIITAEPYYHTGEQRVFVTTPVFRKREHLICR